MKGVFVILDGVSDLTLPVLGMKTPLESAKTPNLDFIAQRSELFNCYPIKQGITPNGASSLLSLFGYDSGDLSKAFLEAKGERIPVSHGDVVFRINFASVDHNKVLLDRRCGRTLTFKEIRSLADSVKEKVKLPFPFDFYLTYQHRGLLIFRGGFSDNVSEVDTQDFSNTFGSNKIHYSSALDDEQESILTAEMLNKFVDQSAEILSKHPVNVDRVRKGLYPANFLLCKSPGTDSVRLKRIKGNWLGSTYTPLERGFCYAAKIPLLSFRYPISKKIDSYDYNYSALKKGIKNGIRVLKKARKKSDYAYIHIKETSLPGFDNKPLDKVKMIEMLDSKLFSFLKGFVERNEGKLVICSNYTVSSRTKTIVSDPVPALFYNGGNKISEGNRFTEAEVSKHKVITGAKLLEKTLFIK